MRCPKSPAKFCCFKKTENFQQYEQRCQLSGFHPETQGLEPNLRAQGWSVIFSGFKEKSWNFFFHRINFRKFKKQVNSKTLWTVSEYYSSRHLIKPLWFKIGCTTLQEIFFQGFFFKPLKGMPFEKIFR